jgi:hypothetical protein
MNEITLTTGKTVTDEQRVMLVSECYATRGKITFFDKVNATRAMIGFCDKSLDTQVLFRAQKRHKGEWRYWTGTHWAVTS